MQDLTGMKFGHWNVLRRDDDAKTRAAKWICQCDCGSVKSVFGTYLRREKSLSCGCVKKKDLTGQKFGKLLVLETLYGYKGYNRATYKCQCECGNITYVKGTSIYNTNTCGCYHRVNLVGQKFGKLLVKSMIYDKEASFCDCLCDCGNNFVVRATSLVTGNTKSCGCIHSPSLKGNTYGRLTVINEFYKDKLKRCVCECECGNIITVTGRSLTSGNSTSCGCYRNDARSKNEQFISKTLSEKQIDFIRDKTFDDCVSVRGKKLRFDFYIPEFNIAIEYDGKQHFEPIEFFGGEQSFNIQRQNDEIKNNYCEANNIALIRISYKNKSKDIYNILHNIIFSNPVTTKVS